MTFLEKSMIKNILRMFSYDYEFLIECIWHVNEINNFFSEAATWGVLKTSQNSQENTCVRVSFLIKLQALGLQLY